MTKNVKPKKKEKTAKELKKELEEKTYGMKNKKRSEALKKQYAKIELVEKKKVAEKKEKKVETAKAVVKEKPVENERPRMLCKFLIDALAQHSLSWNCPENCTDIHSLSEAGGAELSIEEYLELKRVAVQPAAYVSESEFNSWLKKKEAEVRLHRIKVEEHATGTKMFLSNPELFKDDEEAVEMDYEERCYSEEE